MQKKIFQTIMGTLFWDFLMFYNVFFSSQMKRSLIISNKHGIFGLPHDLPNDLRLRIFGNWVISDKSQNFTEFHENKFITKFKEKAEIFNIFSGKPMYSIEQRHCLDQ